MAKIMRTNRRFRRRRNYRGRNFRPRNKRRNMNSIQRVIVRTPGAIVPDQIYTIMHYVDDVKTGILGALGTDGTYGAITYRANSPYDPSTYLGNVSVNGYQQMAAIYRKYRVVGMKIKVFVTNVSSEPCMVVVCPSTLDITGATPGYTYNTIQQLVDYPYAKSMILSPTGGQDRAVISNYISVKKFAGHTEAKFDDTYASLNNLNPITLLYWTLAAYTITKGIPEEGNVYFDARVTYYVEWYNRQPITTDNANTLNEPDDHPNDEIPPP